ncbi:Lrp/AsnC ligand binding domain-containing protein [Paraglaciecola sp.]|uniref:Lrp/AsnC ligand binding domain-containing protein n=1 Tax=Paraglaciecola sp. TaxID=1920173 RepID=UPI003EF4EB3E
MRKSSLELDRIDYKILNILQKNCKISNVELAAQVALSPTPCIERVKRLEQHGYIEQYVAHLNPNQLNASLTAYVQVSLEKSTTKAIEEFNKEVNDMPEVIECAMVAGGFDYLIKIRIPDMKGYRKFLGGKLAMLKGISQTHTYVVMEEIKSTHIIPI